MPGVDWKRVNSDIEAIPLTFEEVSEVRKVASLVSLRKRVPGARSNGGRPRTPGELQALSKTAKTMFERLFEQTAENTYVMK